VPESGAHLWDFFKSAVSWTQQSRMKDEGCERIPATELATMATLTGTIIQPSEWPIVFAMDAQYCEARSRLLAEDRARKAKQK